MGMWSMGVWECGVHAMLDSKEVHRTNGVGVSKDMGGRTTCKTRNGAHKIHGIGTQNTWNGDTKYME